VFASTDNTFTYKLEFKQKSQKHLDEIRTAGSDGKQHTYITAANMVLLIDTDHINWITTLKSYEAETLLDVLLTIKWLLNQINLRQQHNDSTELKFLCPT